MQQTDLERIARSTALHSAIDNARGASADEIVSDAEKFRAFLTGTNPTSEGK